MKELLSAVVRNMKSIVLAMYKEVTYFVRNHKNQ